MCKSGATRGLPRKFGVSRGCFTQGAFYGLDAVVAEGGAKGVYFRYVLTYNSKAGGCEAKCRKKRGFPPEQDR